MKELNQYIQEKLIVNNTIQGYNYYPETKDELIDAIREKIDKEGLGSKDNLLNLNDINTSEITDMSYLFSNVEDGALKELSKTGYFDISDWNVSNVKNMRCMFYGSAFNRDISKWNVSNVKNMNWMFRYSKFTGENGDISDWTVSSVEDMHGMFAGSDFDGDLSQWDVSKVKDMKHMLDYTSLSKNPPKWYKE